MESFFALMSGMSVACAVIMAACSVHERIVRGRWWWPGRDEEEL